MAEVHVIMQSNWTIFLWIKYLGSSMHAASGHARQSTRDYHRARAGRRHPFLSFLVQILLQLAWK